MRTIRIKAYKFDELSKGAKETAINDNRDINGNYDWWDGIYYDAENIGLKITSFDLDRNRHAKGHFIGSGMETAEKIKSEHGEDCETYKTAISFISEWNTLVEKYSDGKNKNSVLEENVYDFDGEADDLENEFLKSLLEDYSILLEKEIEYLMSDEAVANTLQANDYEFTKEGKLI